MKIADIDERDLWSSTEIAIFLGVQPSAVSNWQKRGHLDMPYVIVKGMPLWTTKQVRDLMDNRRVSATKSIDRLRELIERFEANGEA